MNRTKCEILLRPKQIAVSVAACFALHAAQLQANPNGPTVVHGSVGFSGLGTSALSITNQGGGNAIINWNGFSIGASELTRFQQFANLAVLNRVTGNQLSSILGALQSDGRLYLINPNGIVFGASARVDVAGLVASSLNLSDQDFLANRLRFTEVPGAGAVVNNGVIATQAGGRVYLVAPTVENNGLVQTPGGDIVLAAGKAVELVDGAFPYVTVKVASDADRATNVGTLIADSGRIGMFGPLVRNAGTVSANAAVAGPGGEIRLVASRDLTLEAGSVVTANGASGGKVVLQATGGTNLIDGTVQAKGSAGAGGQVDALGVRVGVIGHGVIDASGDAGGGSVRVGGDYQGRNAEVQNAERTYVGSDGVIRADAMTTGDGGRVIVWADGDTRFLGSISARGGAQGGNGGFVETSGKQVLVAAGSVTTAAPNGNGGTWLLDPTDINIVAYGGANDAEIAAYGSADGQLLFGEGPAVSEIGAFGIYDAMAAGNNVLLQATNDINLQTSLDSTANATSSLTLAAGSDINLGFGDIRTGGSLTLSAGNAITGGTSGNALESVNGSVTLSGVANVGSLEITAGTGITTGVINASSLDSHVRMLAYGGSISTGSITTSPAGDGWSYVSLDARTGSVSVNGNIVTGGQGIADVTISALGTIGVGSITTGDSFSRNIVLSAGGNITTGSLLASAISQDLPGGSVAVSSASGNIVVDGSIAARGANGAPYQDGRQGGDVTLTAAGSVSVNGSVDVSGGAGGASDSAGNYGGGWGGDGGQISINAGGDVSVSGTLASRGGTGGSGLNASGTSYAYGGDGGDGSSVYVSASGNVSVGAVDAGGGHGGSGGVAVLDASGASAGSGGTIELAAGSALTVGSILGRGGDGGAGGVAEDGSNASGGSGGYGAGLMLSAQGAASIGPVDVSGGQGGSGGSAADFARGGAGGGGGQVEVSADSISMSSVTGIGGNGAAAGNGNDASGGSGGYGASLYLSATGAITTGDIVLNGGHGASAGSGGLYAFGGDGYNGGYMYMSGASISTGQLLARGGAGGAGGSITTGDGYSDGGWGGSGGWVSVSASSYGGGVSTNGPITTGTIDTSGGNGGNSGVVGSWNTSGGNGGSAYYEGGGVYLSGSTILVKGPILARGGNGGNIVNASLQPAVYPGAPYPQAGDGGGGGGVYVYGTELVSINVGGALGAVSIDVSGGTGGMGNAATSPAGSGGDGGPGGAAGIIGTPNMTLFGSVLAAGGAGGAGGSGSASVPGGSGGVGGNGGSIYLDASSTTDSRTGDGIIFVLAGTQFNIQGGTGGAGGADLGAGAGSPGAAGQTLGTFNSMSDYFGTIVVLDPLSVPEVNSAYQQAVEGANDSSVFVGGEDDEKDEDKSKKEFGACKA